MTLTCFALQTKRTHSKTRQKQGADNASAGAHRGTLEIHQDGGELEREAPRPKRTHSQTRASSRDSTADGAAQREKRRWRRSESTWTATAGSGDARPANDEKFESDRCRSGTKISAHGHSKEQAAQLPVSAAGKAATVDPTERLAEMQLSALSTSRQPAGLGSPHSGPRQGPEAQAGVTVRQQPGQQMR